MKLSLGFSPCPNDTFIFDSLVNKKIDTEGIEFEPILEDVQTLNEWASIGKLSVTKLSFPALFNNLDKYTLLNAGSALGKGVGPLLIGKKMVDVREISNCTIAIPGENTTANFLLSFAFPNIARKVPFLFSQIEDAVLEEKADLGVIIHENRFTYQQRGLHKICDLGQVWEERQNAPVPLGGIAAKKICLGR
jgi:1,4-dihydroxy-6-naphthoate synthase